MLFIIPLLFLLSTGIRAQNAARNLYSAAFSNNQRLTGQQLQLEKSLYALKEAQALFMPNISFGASYTKADGGHCIDLPLICSIRYINQQSAFGFNKFYSLQNKSVNFC